MLSIAICATSLNNHSSGIPCRSTEVILTNLMERIHAEPTDAGGTGRNGSEDHPNEIQ